jgi:hypothetical protein
VSRYNLPFQMSLSGPIGGKFHFYGAIVPTNEFQRYTQNEFSIQDKRFKSIRQRFAGGTGCKSTLTVQARGKRRSTHCQGKPTPWFQ